MQGNRWRSGSNRVIWFVGGIKPEKLTSYRAWDALRTATRCRALVAFHRGRCVMHAGAAAAGMLPGSAAPGPICERALETGNGNYLANLVLYPGAHTPSLSGLATDRPGGVAMGAVLVDAETVVFCTHFSLALHCGVLRSIEHYAALHEPACAGGTKQLCSSKNL